MIVKSILADTSFFGKYSSKITLFSVYSFSRHLTEREFDEILSNSHKILCDISFNILLVSDLLFLSIASVNNFSYSSLSQK